jgi:hypothetical protein
MIPTTLLTVISLLGVACGSETVSCAVGNTDDICLPLRHKDGAPVCPEGLTSCGDKCITPDIACCDGGAHTCPKGNACAPPPLNCAEAETTSLGRPGDQVLPTTAADFSLPGPPETTASEPKETGEYPARFEAHSIKLTMRSVEQHRLPQRHDQQRAHPQRHNKQLEDERISGNINNGDNGLRNA